MPFKTTYLFTLFFAFVITANAQPLPHINYNTHNGLPQIQVQELFQDSKGYIWVGTKGGLAKFNGEKFEHFLSNNYIYGIGETLSKTVYAITNDSLYKQERGKLKNIDKLSGRVFLITGKDNLWLFNGYKILEYRKDTLYQTIKGNADIEGHFLSAIYNPKKDELLFSTSLNTIYCLKDKKITKLTQFEVPATVHKFPNGYIYYCLHPSDVECIYINPENKEMLLKYKRDNTIHDVEVGNLPLSQFVLSYYALRDCYSIDSLTRKAIKMQMPFEEEVYSFIIDKDENYWIGTDNGLYQINNKAFKTFPRSFINNSWTMIRGKDGNYYGGFYKVGLFRLDLEKQQKNEVIVKGITKPVETDYYYGSSMDNYGNLYFPTHNGLVKYNYKKAKIFDTGISLITKYDSYSDKIVFGQQSGIGFIDKNEKTEIYTDSARIVIPSHPAALDFKSTDEIWIGHRKGLAVFNKKTQKFTPVTEKYHNQCPQQYIISTAKDYKNNMWFGGQSELWLYDATKDNFMHVGKEFFKTNILALISPDPNLLIIGTSHEIFAMRLDKFYREGKIEYKMFNYRNGFFSEEVAQNGFLLDGDNIFIPSSTTTSVFNYKKLSFEPNYFSVLVTSINKIGLSNEEQSRAEPFRLEKGVNKLDIDFEPVGFGFPTRSIFKYKLEGEDNDWSNWSETNTVHYSNLGSGKYTFRVIAKNGDKLGEKSEIENAVDIVIKLPFFKEPNFYKYAFFAFLLLALVVGLLIWKTYKNRIAVQARERQIKLLEVATLQAQINPHFIFNFLSSIQSLISQKMPEKANEYLVKFSRLIRSYMESSIKSTKLLHGNTLENENTVGEEIELLKTYVELEKLKYPEDKINFVVDINDNAILNRTIPPMILQPFVENAIKHGILPKEGTGTVTVQFRLQDETLVCNIIDDGIGRKQAMQNKEKSIQANKSRGLQLIVSRVEMLSELDYNIKIGFEDPETGGTVVVITIQG